MTSKLLKCVSALGLLLVLTWGAAAAPGDLARVKQEEEARVKMVEQLSKTVVAVFRVKTDGDRTPTGGGSGVIIGTDGTALTNYHVVETSKKVMVGTSDGVLHEADVVGTDPTGDIAVIRIKDGGPFEAASLGDSDQLEAGQWVLAMGNPFLLATDFAPTVSMGVVSANHRYLPGTWDFSLIYTDCIQTDAAINPGNSGGPLFTVKGELVGINGRITGRAGGRRTTTQVNTGVGFAIPINQIKRFLPDLTAGKDVRHGILGIEAEEGPDGVKVSRVWGDSAADKAGIKVGDRVLTFQGREVNSQYELMNRIGLLPAGSPVTLSVEREGQTIALEVKLDARPVGEEITRRPVEEPEPAEGDEPEPAEGEGAPTASQVAKRYAEALGGYQRLEALKTLSYEAKVRVRLPSGVEIVGQQRAYQRGHRNVRSETNLRVGSNVLQMVSNFNGKQGWRSTPEGVKELTDEEVKERLTEAIVFEQLEAPGGWDGPHAKYLGTEKVGKEECSVVETTDDAGAKRKFYFSDKTGLLLKYSHYSSSQKGEVDDFYEDYRDIGGGLKQAFKLYRMASGVRLEMIEVQKAESNPDLNDALFNEPPKQIMGSKVF